MESSPAKRLSTFATDPDDDLLGYMAMQAEDPESARQAGAEFYERHKEFLFAVLKGGRFGRIFGDDRLADFVQETFFTAYTRANTYRPSGVDDRVRQRQAVRAWIVGIAKNVARTALSRSSSIVAEVSFDDCADIPADVLVPPDKDTEVRNAMREAIDSLDEREQDVLRTSMLFFRPGEPHQRLPNAEAQALAARWATTTVNIRAVRKRAFDKLKGRAELILKAAKGKVR